MAQCPRCGSYNAKYELRAAGTDSRSSYYRTGVKKSWILPAGRKTYSSNRRQKTVGFCPDCGYQWDEKSIPSGNLFQKFCLLISGLWVFIGICMFFSLKNPFTLSFVLAGLIGIFGYGNKTAVTIELVIYGVWIVVCILFGIFDNFEGVAETIIVFAIPAIMSAIKFAMLKRSE